MIRIVILTICFGITLLRGQDKALFLFMTADSLYQGVKDGDSAVIIAAEYPVIGPWISGESITDSIIDFYGLPKGITWTFDSLRAAHTFNTTFNRNGQVLYHPFLYDNGADYIEEGARRFVDVKTGKMGLVHPYGRVLIPAKYDFLMPLKNGYTTAYRGVKRKSEARGEHWSIVPDSTKQFRHTVVNRMGLEVKGHGEKDAENSVRLDDGNYYPTVYTIQDPEEQKMLDMLSTDQLVMKAAGPQPEKWQLKIIERPSPKFPYYVLGNIQSILPIYIAVDANARLYYFDYYRMIPLADYLAAREY